MIDYNKLGIILSWLLLERISRRLGYHADNDGVLLLNDGSKVFRSAAGWVVMAGDDISFVAHWRDVVGAVWLQRRGCVVYPQGGRRFDVVCGRTCLRGLTMPEAMKAWRTLNQKEGK